MPIAIIPARGGSKRLPGKNIRILGGMPLLAHSIRYALSYPHFIDWVIVSTDDEQIAAVAIEYGAEVVLRPAEISGDEEPTVSALQIVLQTVESDVVVFIQPTNPLRPMGLLEKAFEVLGDSDGVFTVSRSYHKLGTINHDRFVPYNYTPGQRSQDLEPLYYENGLLYLCKSDVVRQGKIITDASVPLVIDHVFGDVDIDTADDFEYAEFLFQKHQDESIY